MTTGLVVLKMVLMPSRQRLASLANSGPRWSMIGVSIARRTRSGKGVGPGVERKGRFSGRQEVFVDFEFNSQRGLLMAGRKKPRPPRRLAPPMTASRGR